MRRGKVVVMLRMGKSGMVRGLVVMVMVMVRMKELAAMMVELAVLWRGKEEEDLQQQQQKQQRRRLGGEGWQVGQAAGAGRGCSSGVQVMQLVVVAAAGPLGLQQGLLLQQQQQVGQLLGMSKAAGMWLVSSSSSRVRS
jgi:hypothetical protein